MEKPFVSIIIPCRNEKKHIARCLDSIICQDFPKDRLKILAVDGMSTDGTKEIIQEYSQKYPFIHLLENPNKFTPFGLNLGIQKTKGEIIMRMDAHAGYEKDYVSKCVKYLEEYGADNVGGVMRTLPAKNTIQAKAIAISLSSRFGAASDFRVGSSQPKEVDTVFGGCYKKEIFDKIGLFNENLIRSQDLEFNLRLKRAGGKILLVLDIVSYYYPKSNLWAFFKHNVVDGIWSIYPLKFIKMPFSLRHYIPLLFVLSLLGSILFSIFFPIFGYLFILIIGLYSLLSFYFSVKITLKEKDPRYFFVMPVAFASRHIGYGLGSIFGIFKIIFNF